MCMVIQFDMQNIFLLINELNNWRCDNNYIDKIRAVSTMSTFSYFAI